MVAPFLSVVAGALLRTAQGGEQVLLARRPESAHQGGKWEFPGGKREPGESPPQTLARELEEEIGVRVRETQPLIRFPWEYPEFRMDFEVFRVTAWDGRPEGCEGQEVRWVSVAELGQWTTPPASLPVIGALQLPACYAISADPAGDVEGWRLDLEQTLAAGTTLIQLRAHSLPEREFEALAREAVRQVQAAGARVLLNAEPELALRCGADGVHLSSRRLMRLEARPLSAECLVGASCHDPEELAQAVRIGTDFAVLSPVRDGESALGWAGFAAAVAGAALPVYALGGMRAADQAQAIQAGGQGIAAIRGLWGVAAGPV